MYILSQVFVVLSDILCILSMLCKKKKLIIFFLLFSTVTFISHYICLGAWTGVAIGCVEIVFLIAMYILELKDKTKYNIYLSMATIVATIVLSIITWDTWISFIPMIAMVEYLITMLFSNVIIVKSGVFVRVILNAVYMLLIKSYFGAGMSLVILAFSIYGIIKDNLDKNKKVKEVAGEEQKEEQKEVEN